MQPQLQTAQILAVQAPSEAVESQTDPLLLGLTPEQLQVVLAPAGPLLVLAGAGSGKTRTLTHRVAHLLRPAGAKAPRVLLMTFTQAAAREMLQRTSLLLQRELSGARQLQPTAAADPLVWAGTFHQIAARCLRCHGGRLGLAQDFAVLAPEDAVVLLRQCLNEPPAGKLAKAGPAARARLAQRRPEALLALFSRAVNLEVPLAEAVAARAPELADLGDALLGLCDAYAQRKMAQGRLDFDDLLLLWRLLLCDVPDVAAALQVAFDHVLVDEYQDVSPLQAAIVRGLSGGHGSLTVVGDPGQAIYGFRGADAAQILRFAGEVAGTQVLRLTGNHRSTAAVVGLANRVLGGGALTLRAARGEEGEAPQVLTLADEASQASWVAERAAALHAAGRPLREMAVLYRNHAHGRSLPDALRRVGLPFTVRSGPEELPFEGEASGAAADASGSVGAEGLVLSTVHRAKGLEWAVVFVVGLSEGSFPSLRPGSDLQEERRLFYVAVTRARDTLYLCAPRAGASGAPRTPSRYLRELRTAQE